MTGVLRLRPGELDPYVRAWWALDDGRVLELPRRAALRAHRRGAGGGVRLAADAGRVRDPSRGTRRSTTVACGGRRSAATRASRRSCCRSDPSRASATSTPTRPSGARASHPGRRSITRKESERLLAELRTVLAAGHRQRRHHPAGLPHPRRRARPQPARARRLRPRRPALPPLRHRAEAHASSTPEAPPTAPPASDSRRVRPPQILVFPLWQLWSLVRLWPLWLRPNGPGVGARSARLPGKKAAPPPSLLDRLTAALASALGSHAGDVVGLLCVAVGIVAGMGVYANAAGPVGRGLDDGIGMVVGWGRVIVPVALVALGIVLVRGSPRRRRRRRICASQSYLWVGGLMIAVGGCGLLHLTNGRPGLWTRPSTSSVDAGGLLGVAAAGPLAAGIAPWGAGLILAALVLAGLVVLTRVPVRVAAESTAAATRPAGLALVDAAQARRRQPLLARRRRLPPAHGGAALRPGRREPHRPRRAGGGRTCRAPPRRARASRRCSSRSPTSRSRPSSSRSSSARP